MSLTDIRGKMSLLFLAFFLLITVSVGVTFRRINAQREDALVINLAGRQRMLTQQMTWLALTSPESPELNNAIQRFDQTLLALRHGGSTLDAFDRPVTLPPAPDEDLHSRFDRINQTWRSFQDHLERTQTLKPSDSGYEQTRQDLQMNSRLILAQLDSVVDSFETRAQEKVTRLFWIQWGFLISALVLLVGGFLITHFQVLIPLANLGKAARRMGEGDLSTPFPNMPQDEIGELASMFEATRLELASSQEHLESRVWQRTRELDDAFEFSQEIVSQLDIDHLLKSVTDRARLLMDAEEASLCLLTRERDALKRVATSGGYHDMAEQRQTASAGLAARVMGSKGTLRAESGCAPCVFLQNHPDRPCAAAPLRVGSSTLGALCVVRKEGTSFDQDENRALTLLANSAAIAITNARLVEESNQQMKQTTILAERERFAAELHDNLAQTLSYVRLKMEGVTEMLKWGQTETANEELTKIETALENAYGQVRRALVELQAPPSSAENLTRDLEAYLGEFEQTSGVDVTINIIDSTALSVSPQVGKQILHIVREALTNVRRHADARRVWLKVERVDGKARFIVQDDGRGFDLQSAPGENHLGLGIMQTRAERSGGKLILDTAPGRGARVIVSFPLME